MAKATPVQRLRALNSLLCTLNASAPEEANEIRKAVEFYIEEIQELDAKEIQFSTFAREILDIHIKGKNGERLCFWAIDPNEREPLFLRSSFIKKLEALRQFPSATFVIYGLQDTVFPDQKYWTQKVESEYNEIRNYLESVAAEWQPPGCKLNLIYV